MGGESGSGSIYASGWGLRCSMECVDSNIFWDEMCSICTERGAFALFTPSGATPVLWLYSCLEVR
jgi:hypothetical protein